MRKISVLLILVTLFIVFITYMASAQWVQTNGPYSGHVSSFAVSGETIFAGINDGVFLSTDNGTSWKGADSGLPDFYINSFAVRNTTIFVGSQYGGVYRSTNNGTSWTAVNSDLSKARIQALAVSGKDIFAAAYGNGIWRRPLSEMVGIFDHKKSQKTVPETSFKIVFSNQAGSLAAVEFSLLHSDQVTVKMYTVAGREMSSIVNRRCNPGSYRYVCDTQTFTQGCYIIRMQTGMKTRSKIVRITH